MGLLTMLLRRGNEVLRALVIGIDGATLDIISPMLERGELPNIEGLIKRGVFGKLRSVFPPVTFPAWTSFRTGKNPAKHGVFEFLRGIPYTSEEVHGISVGDIREKSLWRLLSDHGYQVGVVNVPATYPPESVNGLMVSGFGTPDLNCDFTYPKELKSTLLNNFRYELDLMTAVIDKEDQFMYQLKGATEKLTDTACFLLGNYDFDFFMITFMAADNASHAFFGYREPSHPLFDPEKSKYGRAIEDIYQFIDDKLGHILTHIGEGTNIFIVSDHGFGPALKSLYLNEWLIQEEFLKLKGNKTSSLRQDNLLQRLTKWERSAVGSNLAKHFLRFWREKTADYLSWTKEVDWSKTLAYSGGYYGKIYINLKGREKEGIVVPGAEYEKIITKLKEKLYQWTDPDTGERIVDKVYRKEEIYSGKYLGLAPDLTAIIKDMAYVDWPDFRDGRIFYPPRRGGDHRLNGIFIASGPEIGKTGSALTNLSICDCAPTILHLLGLPVPDDMDGRVLKEIFREGSEPAQRDVVYQKVDREEKNIKDRIRKLKESGKL
jgi:predicted AlkP superfamily phosphohydrolase/phosphomutase